MRRLTIVVVALLTALLAASPALAVDEVNTKRLRDAVTVGGILAHERVFQRIANQNGGTRASGTPGYDASADYVASRLDAAGYEVTTQEFEFPFSGAPPASCAFTPTPTTYSRHLDYSGSGDAKAGVHHQPNVIPPRRRRARRGWSPGTEPRSGRAGGRPGQAAPATSRSRS